MAGIGTKHAAPPVLSYFTPYQGNDPTGFVLAKNLARRHLNEAQRAVVAAKIANMRQGARTDLSPIGERLVSQGRAAEMLNVGKRSVERAHKVLTKGTPELAAKVASGKVSVAKAVASLRPKPATLKQALKQLSPEARRAAKNTLRLVGNQDALLEAKGKDGGDPQEEVAALLVESQLRAVPQDQIESAMRDIERIESEFRDNNRLCELLRAVRGELMRIAIQVNAKPLNAAE